MKDMVRDEPHLAELVARDLEIEAMSLSECEKKIKAYADKHKTGSFSCVLPAEAEKIIREFYGLSKAVEAPAPGEAPKIISLSDFL